MRFLVNAHCTIKIKFVDIYEYTWLDYLIPDPDAPSRADPKFGQFQHWLVTNIPGNDIAKGDEMTAYVGSGAPQGTGT